MSNYKKFFIIIFATLFLSNTAFADIYPVNAITSITKTVTSGTTTISSSTTDKTILGLQIAQKSSSPEVVVYCGTKEIFYNSEENSTQVFFNYICNNTIRYSRTGTGDIIVALTYVNYNITNNIPDTVIVTSNFSSGDMLICFFLLLIIFFILVYFLRSAINSVKIHRRYQGNNSPDGKEFYEL